MCFWGGLKRKVSFGISIWFGLIWFGLCIVGWFCLWFVVVCCVVVLLCCYLLPLVLWLCGLVRLLLLCGGRVLCR